LIGYNHTEDDNLDFVSSQFDDYDVSIDEPIADDIGEVDLHGLI
jgi:hypothetical protein